MSEETANTPAVIPPLKNVEYIRLVSGMNIVAEVREVRDPNTNWVVALVFKKPMQIAVEYLEEQQASALIFYPWLPVTSIDAQEVEVERRHVLFHSKLANTIIPQVEKYMDRTYDLERKVHDPKAAANTVTVAPTEAKDPFEAFNILFPDKPTKLS